MSQEPQPFQKWDLGESENFVPKSPVYKETSLGVWLKCHFENHSKWLGAADKSPAQSGQQLHLQLVNRVQEQLTEIQKGLRGRRLQARAPVTQKKRLKQWQGGPRCWPGGEGLPGDVHVRYGTRRGQSPPALTTGKMPGGHRREGRLEAAAALPRSPKRVPRARSKHRSGFGDPSALSPLVNQPHGRCCLIMLLNSQQGGTHKPLQCFFFLLILVLLLSGKLILIHLISS